MGHSLHYSMMNNNTSIVTVLPWKLCTGGVGRVISIAAGYLCNMCTGQPVVQFVLHINNATTLPPPSRPPCSTVVMCAVKLMYQHHQAHLLFTPNNSYPIMTCPSGGARVCMNALFSVYVCSDMCINKHAMATH